MVTALSLLLLAASPEVALLSTAPEAEITELMRAVRALRNTNDKSERRQSAAGQIAGLIHDVPTVAALIEGMLADAQRLAEKMPAIAKARLG